MDSCFPFLCFPESLKIADVVVVCCVHLNIERDEVPGGEAKLFDDLEADQAALAACVRHSADECVCLWCCDGESEVSVVLPTNVHPQSYEWLRFRVPPQPLLGYIVEYMMG